MRASLPVPLVPFSFVASFAGCLVACCALSVAVVDVAHAGGLARPRSGEPAGDARGDVATLPQKYPEATWLPLDLVGLRLRTTLLLNGVPVPVILDTGAATTVVNPDVAHRIGLDAPLVVRHPIQTVDANSDRVDGYLADIDAVVIGAVRVRGVRAAVLPMPGELTVLIGYDVLAHVDLFFAVDEGLIGIFAPGKGPPPPRSQSLRITTVEVPMLFVPFDESGREAENFILDTGSPVTLLDRAKGDAFGLPLDARFQSLVTGVSGKSRTTTGAYRVPSFRIGHERVDIGPVVALRGEVSLLGNDVTLRHRTLLSSDNALLSLSPLPVRPGTRSTGPDGKPCAAGPCVAVAIGEQPAEKGGPCLSIDIDAAWSGQTVAGLVDVLGASGDSAVGGGLFFFEARVPAAGMHVCVDTVSALRTWKVPPTAAKQGTTTSLLRFHVPAEPACKQDLCVGFTGAIEPAKKP